MNWNEVLEHPSLHDLPFKIELNSHGCIEMSPASNLHCLLQTRIAFELQRLLPNGKAFTECSIETQNNVKVADAVWVSDAFLAKHGLVTPLPQSPEIVVEVISPSNRGSELQNKKALYFERGAQEVWLCRMEGESGRMAFYDSTGELAASKLCPLFPLCIS